MKSGIRLILSVFAILPVIPSFGEDPDQVPAPDCAEVDQTKPLKIFILAGQSNMQGHAKVSTIDSMRLDPKTAPILKEMRNADGSSKVCEGVWISSIGSSDEERIGTLSAGFGADQNGSKIGPEFTFGILHSEASGGFANPDHQNLMGWQEFEHRLSAAGIRSLRI